MKKELLTVRDDMFVIRDFFSDADCQQYIEKCEAVGFGEATVNAAGGAIVNKNMRNNERVIDDDCTTAHLLWERLVPFLPTKEGLTAVGLNERFRYYRYEPGQFFDWHFDGSYRRSHREFSTLTFMVYLNDGFTGGSTDFHFGEGRIRDDDPVLTVVPAKGMALIFTHNVLHRGAEVLTGRKYVMRSDVMSRM